MSKPSTHNYRPDSNGPSQSFTALINKVKDVSMLDVASKLGVNVGSMTLAGANLTGDCPMGHASASGKSFHITPHMNLCHCWNCGLGGDNIKLVETVKNFTFYQAMQWIMKEFNFTEDLGTYAVRKRTPEEIQEEIWLKTKTLLYEELIRWGKELLYDKNTTDQNARDALNYLTGYRRYDLGILKTTEFFYIPDTNTAKAHLLKVYPQYSKDINELRISGGFGDEMRIGVPYRSSTGLITGLVKRHQSSSGFVQGTNADGSPKRNRWDSTRGLKKEDMFGLYGLLQLNPKVEDIIVVEGYPDSMYMQALGLPVVSLGSAIPTDGQLDSLLKLKKLLSLTLSLDNDAAGIKNTNEVLLKLSKRSNVLIEVLPAEELGSDKDLDEYLRTHGDAETQKLVATKSLLGIFWHINNEKEKNFGRLKNSAISPIYDLIAMSPPVVQDLVIGKSKEYLGIHVSAIKAAIKERELTRWNGLFALNSQVNPIFHWRKIPFTHSEGYGVYDRTKKVPDPEVLDAREIKELTKFDRVTMSTKGRGHVEDLVRGFIPLPPVFPELNITYDPIDFYEIDVEDRLINTFMPTKWMFYEKNEEIINPQTEFPVIYDFLDHLLGQDDGISVHKVINWISCIFNERSKLETSFVVVGAQGAGKNVFVDFIIKYLFGFPNVSVVGDHQLNNQFNDFLSKKLFIVFNELSALKESQKAIQTFLKALVTDPTHQNNTKFMKLKQEVSWFNFVFISNFLSPVAIDMNDRRFNCIKVPDIKLKDSAFFKKYGWGNKDFYKFREALEEQFPRFVQYLKNMDYSITDANSVVMNKTKLSMIQDNNTVFVQFAQLLKERDSDELMALQADGMLTTTDNPYPWEEEHLAQGVIEVNQALNIVNQMASNFSTRISVNILNNKMYEQGIERKRLRLDCSWRPELDRAYFYVLPGSKWSDEAKPPEKTKEEKIADLKKEHEQSMMLSNRIKAIKANLRSNDDKDELLYLTNKIKYIEERLVTLN